jgi:hypothetical protein
LSQSEACSGEKRPAGKGVLSHTDLISLFLKRNMLGRMWGFVRRCIYNRWFYAVLAAVCLLDVVCEISDILRPGSYPVLDVISLVTSGIAAALTFLIFVDLHGRRDGA